MPKQRGRGGKRGRKAKKGMTSKRDLVFKEDGQEYAQVKKLLGNGTATVACFDGRDRLGIICGRMKNRVWIQVGDILLVSLREFEDGGKKCDVIYKYFSEEAKQLKAMGELPDTTVIEDKPQEEEDIQLVWEEGEQDQEEEEEDDDDDLPPSDSDDDYYNEKAKPASKKKVIEEDEEDEIEEKKPEAKVEPKATAAQGKKPLGNAKAPAKPEEKKAQAPNKLDAKKAAQSKKKAEMKKKAGGDDSSSDESKDDLDDI